MTCPIRQGEREKEREGRRKKIHTDTHTLLTPLSFLLPNIFQAIYFFHYDGASHNNIQWAPLSWTNAKACTQLYFLCGGALGFSFFWLLTDQFTFYTIVCGTRVSQGLQMWAREHSLLLVSFYAGPEEFSIHWVSTDIVVRADPLPFWTCWHL